MEWEYYLSDIFDACNYPSGWRVHGNIALQVAPTLAVNMIRQSKLSVRYCSSINSNSSSSSSNPSRENAPIMWNNSARDHIHIRFHTWMHIHTAEREYLDGGH